jgi:hypothetical protein
MAQTDKPGNSAAARASQADGYIMRAKIDGQHRYFVDDICQITPWAYMYNVQCKHPFTRYRAYAKLINIKRQSPCMRRTCCWRRDWIKPPKELKPHKRIRADPSMDLLPRTPSSHQTETPRPAGPPRRTPSHPKVVDDPIKDGYEIARDDLVPLPSEYNRPNVVSIRRAPVDDPQRLYFLALDCNERLTYHDWQPAPDFHINDIPCSEPAFTVRFAEKKKNKGGNRKDSAAANHGAAGASATAGGSKSVLLNESAKEGVMLDLGEDMQEFVIVDEDDLQSMAASWVDLEEELGDDDFPDTQLRCGLSCKSV